MSHKLGDLFHHNHKENHMSGKPSIVFCHGIWADGSCCQRSSEFRSCDHEISSGLTGRGDISVRRFGG
jgi:hypothetical protein